MKLLLAVLAALILNSWVPGDAIAQTGMNVTGKVVEVKDVEAYTYLRLKTADGEIWAAVNRAPVKAGTVVTIANAMVMSNFESKSLKRKFDRILFGNLGKTPEGAKLSSMAAIGAPAPAMPPAAMGNSDPHSAGAQKLPPNIGDVKVPKATGPNARTVAEIVMKKAELKGKQVVVRGKVVKFNSGIMGKNWVHLRDGSGSDKDRSNDLIVTTKDPAKVGEVVVATGVVRTDVELGSGYSYPVLVEDAKLGK